MNINDLKVKDEYKHFIPRPSHEDYERIKESIDTKGIEDAIVINQDNIIVDGYTRYDIAQELSITDVPIDQKHFSNEIEEQEFIIRKNFHRRQLNNAQKAEIGLKIKKFEEIKAKQRQDRTKSKDEKTGEFTTSGNISLSGEKGQSRDKAAQQVKLSGKTLDKAKNIKEFIEEHDDDNGEDVQKLWDEALNDKRSISSVHNEMKRFEINPKKNPKKLSLKESVVLDNFTCPISKKKLQIICVEKNNKYKHILKHIKKRESLINNK